MAPTVSLYFQGDPRGAVNATKTVENALGGLKKSTEDVGRTQGQLAAGVQRHWGAIRLAAVGALLAIAAGAGKAGTSASDLGEQISKTRTVFRGSEQDILAWSKTTADRLGISRRAALEATGTLGNMLVPMGLARTKAGEMSTKMVELAADMASFNNASPEETLEALRSGLAGESEPLRKFGVLLSEARVQAEAVALGLVKQGQKLSESDKAMARYRLVLKDTKDAQGDFARTSDSVANKERVKAATFEDTQAKLGQGLLPVMRTFNGILTAGAKFASEHSTAVTVLVGVVAGLAAGVLAINSALAVYRAAVVAVTAVQWLLNAAMAANPLGLTVIALAALAAGLVLAWQHSETFRAIVTGAFDAVKIAADAVLGFFRTAWSAITALISSPISTLVDAARGAFGLKGALENAFRAIKTFVGDRVDDIVAFFRALPDRLLNHVRTLITNALEPFKAAFTAAKDWVSAKVAEIVAFFAGLPGRIADTLEALSSQAIEPLKKLFTKVSTAVNGIKTGILWVKDHAVKIWTAVKDALEGPLNALHGFLSPIDSVLGSIIRAIDGIIGSADKFVSAIGKVKSIAGGIAGGIGGLIPGRQHGGPVDAGRAYIVGERGPELFVPSASGEVIANSALRSSATPGGSTGEPRELHVHVHAGGFMIGNRQELAYELGRMIVPYLPDGHRVAGYRSPA
jgi:hypothetical protein